MLVVALLLLLATSGPRSAAAARRVVQQSIPPDWAIADGQKLADAVADWGRSNTDQTFTLQPATLVDLRDSSFWGGNGSLASGLKPFSSGKLTISGSKSWDVMSEDAVASSVLDTGMRGGMTPSLVTVQVIIQDLAVVNLCQVYFPLGDTVVTGTTLLGIFSISLAAQPAFSVRSTYYIPRAELLEVAYWQLVIKSPWRAVSDLYEEQGPTMAAMQRLDFELHAHEMFISFPDGAMIWRSVDKPNDPLMSFMRRRGLAMEDRWCHNGSLVPREFVEMRPLAEGRFFGLMWTAGTLDELVVGLVNGTLSAPLQHAAKMPIPAVMTFLPRVNLSDSFLPSGALELAGPLILHGHMLPAVTPASLDLTSRAGPLFNVTGSAGQLYVTRLVLRVPSLSLAALAAASNTSNSTTSRQGAMVELSYVTLVVPVLDYLALLTLATDNSSIVGSIRGCVDQTTLQQAAQLWPVVQTLRLTSAAWSNLNLAAYTAWGVNASRLIVQPQTPVPASITQRCPNALQKRSTTPPTTSSNTDEGGDSSAPVGLIVGCTVGGAVLLMAVAAIAVLAWRRNHRAKYRADTAGHHLGDHGDDKGSVRLDVTSPVLPASAHSHSAVSSKGEAQPVPGAPAAPPESRLAALLHQQEQELLGDLGAPGANATSRPPSGGAAAAASNLDQAHQQLMSVVAARQTNQSAAVVSSSSADTQMSDPQAAVKQVATRLQGLGDGADKLTLDRVVGQGGGGTVYKGTWRGLPVAVKTFVFEALASEKEGKLSFRHQHAVMETAISASVGHMHVVATYHHDIKRMDDRPHGGEPPGGLQVDAPREGPTPHAAAPGIQTYKVFLVQELCTCSLRTALHQGLLGNEPLGASLALLHQVASGLEYLHGLGIIHGDLTPGNILLKADGKSTGVVVKLADFGLSNRLDGQATHVSNFGAGTPFYVAPEVVHQKRTSPASDIFSFGIVAWELLSHCPVYVEGPDGSMRPNPLFPNFPSDAPKPPKEVERLVRLCVSQHPQKRPTATEVMAVLDHLLVAGVQ